MLLGEFGQVTARFGLGYSVLYDVKKFLMHVYDGGISSTFSEVDLLGRHFTFGSGSPGLQTVGN